ncbi:hypothetical protein OA953_02840 [Gammaproteobacteria bacterium]|nr:hypothetical protein [Gammaproteobacteria bacterium]
MTKYYLLIFYSFLLVSCVSSGNFTKSELNYNAKVKIFDETNIIKSNISVFQNRIIIQFYEYIVGNLAKIELNDDGNILIDGIDIKNIDFDINNFSNKKYFQVLNSCLRKNIEEYSDEKLSINCNENGAINFDINNLGQIKIKLVISKKLERKDKTPSAAK